MLAIYWIFLGIVISENKFSRKHCPPISSSEFGSTIEVNLAPLNASLFSFFNPSGNSIFDKDLHWPKAFPPIISRFLGKWTEEREVQP